MKTFKQYLKEDTHMVSKDGFKTVYNSLDEKGQKILKEANIDLEKINKYADYLIESVHDLDILVNHNTLKHLDTPKIKLFEKTINDTLKHLEDVVDKVGVELYNDKN